jgi:gamma-glutamylcysteine synthetase
VLDLARELFAIASQGLARQGCSHGDAPDERVVLEPLAQVLDDGRSPAEVWRRRWEGELGRDPLRLVDAMSA